MGCRDHARVLCFDQVVAVSDARRLGLDFPRLAQTPAELSGTSISSSPGKRLGYLGYEFEVSRDDLDESRVRLIDRVLGIPFRSGPLMMLMTDRPDRFVQSVQIDRSEGAGIGRWLYGPRLLKSDYAFTRAALGSTPADVRLFSSPLIAQRELGLLEMKRAFLLKGESVFSVESRLFRGFQFGRPPDNRIVVDLYDNRGYVQLTFVHCRNRPSVNQSKINRVIQTIRPVQDRAHIPTH